VPQPLTEALGHSLAALDTQLLALTHLKVYWVGAAVAAVTDAAAQLTGLRQLELTGLPQVTHTALLQLTALTVLERITLHV
jgi:hypothetical protein